MAKDVLDEQPRDTSTVTSGSIGIDGDAVRVFQIVNTLDVTFDYEFQATYKNDDSFANAVTLGGGTVNSGSVTSEGISEAWDDVRVTVTPQNSPTSGSVIVKKHE